MAELAFLSAVHDYLAAKPLSPVVAANRIGALEPSALGDLPCLVLSLEATGRRRVGLGDRSDLMRGALSVPVSIDLANPALPGDPTFSLIDNTRRVVILPHGGLVRSDGAEALAPLAPGDITVRVDDVPVTVVPGAPGPGEVQADPIVGQLRFGDPLKAVGTLGIVYFLGQWERRVERIAGVLRADACAGSGTEADRLGASCVTRLLAPDAAQSIQQLTSIELTVLGSVEQRPAPPPPPNVGVTHFRRRAAFAFEYHRLVDRVESSGGVIHRVPLVSRLSVDRFDAASGKIIAEIAHTEAT
jgi:hypothetical protein